MCLKSAYSKYSGGQEPRCTYIHESHRATYDYIFYSHESLLPTRVLSIPATNDLRDVDPREPKKIPDPFDKKPKDWDDRKEIITINEETGDETIIENPNFKGNWEARMVSNMNRWHNYLPNSKFASDHFALMADLRYVPAMVAGNGWNSDIVLKKK